MQNQEVGGAKAPLSLLLLGSGATLLAGALSGYVGLLFLAALLLATVLQAAFLRFHHRLPCLLVTAAALVIAYALSASFVMLPIIACIPLAAYVLARAGERGENRTGMALGVAGIYVLAVACAAGVALVYQMLADGATDLPAYLDSTMATVVDTLAHEWAALYQETADMYLSIGVEVVALSAEEIRETLLLLAALLPGTVLCACYLLGLVATYVMQLTAMLCQCHTLFTQKNSIYRPSALFAGAYLVAMPITMAWGDFRHAFCLVCMNVAAFTLPLFAFGALLRAPRLFAFMRRMSIGRLDFAFFAVLLCLFVFSYALYALPVMAFVYAFYILKSTISPRKGNGR